MTIGHAVSTPRHAICRQAFFLPFNSRFQSEHPQERKARVKNNWSPGSGIEGALSKEKKNYNNPNGLDLPWGIWKNQQL